MSRPVYLASFQWPGRLEPLMIGTSKVALRRAAKAMAIQLYGSGHVDRPGALCSAKITLDDIHVQAIEVMPPPLYDRHGNTFDSATDPRVDPGAATPAEEGALGALFDQP